MKNALRNWLGINELDASVGNLLRQTRKDFAEDIQSAEETFDDLADRVEQLEVWREGSLIHTTPAALPPKVGAGFNEGK